MFSGVLIMIFKNVIGIQFTARRTRLLTHVVRFVERVENVNATIAVTIACQLNRRGKAKSSASFGNGRLPRVKNIHYQRSRQDRVYMQAPRARAYVEIHIVFRPFFVIIVEIITHVRIL